jgi:hypothetical protein
MSTVIVYERLADWLLPYHSQCVDFKARQDVVGDGFGDEGGQSVGVFGRSSCYVLFLLLEV